MSKSHVSIEQKLCTVCGASFDTGTLLFDKRMLDTLEMHTTTGYGLCPEHQKLFDDGYLACVAVDESKSKRQPNGNMRPADAWRTGEVAHLRREAVARIFTVHIPEDLPVIFCEPAVIGMLKQKAAV